MTKIKGEKLEEHCSWSASTAANRHPNNPCLPSVCPHTPPQEKKKMSPSHGPKKYWWKEIR